jgi:hypothetical protein
MASSSELTRKKALKAMYSEVATNVRNGHGVAPLKNGGYRYNSMGITKYDPSPTNQNQAAISNYSSYSQRMDMKLGKQFSNNAINGTENVKYESDTGNLIRVTYKQGTEYNAPLMATGDLNTEGGRLAGDDANDFVPYGESINYPGVIIDNDSSIFKISGNGRCDTCQSWVKTLTSIEHIGSDKWNRLNANEQMTGFSLTSPILLWSAYDINITDAKDTIYNYDLSGYIINGKHRGGILTNSFNPVLYFDPYDHINLTINVLHARSLNINTIDTSLGNYRVKRDIQIGNGGLYNSDISNGVIHWNPKERGVYYYNSVGDDPLIGGKIVIGNIDGGSKNTYSPTDLIIYPLIEASITIPTPSNDNTPSYTFYSNKSGTINISPSNYTITTTYPIQGVNTITFSTLSSGLYTGITITLTDAVGNVSNPLIIDDFRILLDVDGPIITQITPILPRTNNNTPSYVFNITEEGTITINSGTNSGLDFTINDTNTYDTDTTNDVSGGNNTLKITSTDSKTLLDGTYSNISLYTTDVAGNNSSTLTIPTFTIDTTGPRVTNITHISGFNNSQNPSFSFTSSESGGITVSDASFTPLNGNQSNIIETLPVTPQSISIGLNTITFDTLELGAYDISFTLTDDMGNSTNTQLNPFTIDTINPLINVISSPPSSSTNRKPEYDFSSNKQGTLTIIPSNYTISNTGVTVDKNTITFQNLIPMTHSNISIFITDLAGNVSNILVIPPFTVGPLLAEVDTPEPFTNNQNPIYRFSSTLDGSINVYSAFFIPASNPTTSVNKSLPYTTTDNSNIYSNMNNTDASATIVFDTLEEGVYKYIGVTVTDISGNESRPLYIPNFTVDTTAPEISEQTPVPTTTNINPSYVFNSNEIGTINNSDASFSSDDNAYIQKSIAVTPTYVIEGVNTITFTNLELGKYSDISFTVTDRAGNVSNDISDISFEIVAEPQLTMITPIPTLGSDLTPSFTFNTGLAGTIDIGVVNTKAVFDASEGYHHANNVIVDINRTIDHLVDIKKQAIKSLTNITNVSTGTNEELYTRLTDISNLYEYRENPLKYDPNQPYEIKGLYKTSSSLSTSTLDYSFTSVYEALVPEIKAFNDLYINENISNTIESASEQYDGGKGVHLIAEYSAEYSKPPVKPALLHFISVIEDITNNRLYHPVEVDSEPIYANESYTIIEQAKAVVDSKIDAEMEDVIANDSDLDESGDEGVVSSANYYSILQTIKTASDSIMTKIDKLRYGGVNIVSKNIYVTIYHDELDKFMTPLIERFDKLTNTVDYKKLIIFQTDFSINYPLDTPVTLQNAYDASTIVQKMTSYISNISDLSNSFTMLYDNIFLMKPAFNKVFNDITDKEILLTREDISNSIDLSNNIGEMIEIHNKIDSSRNEFSSFLTQIDGYINNIRGELVSKQAEYSIVINNYNTAISNIISPSIVTTAGNNNITFDTLISDITYTDISFTLSSGYITSAKLEFVDFSIDAVPLFTYGPDIPSPSTNSTPTYIFNSKTKAGSIDRNPDFSYHITDTLGGNKITTITADTSNTLTFTTLPIGTYSDISFIFRPTSSPNGNSVKLLIPQFTIYTADVGLTNSANIPVTVKSYYNHNTGITSNGYVFGGGEFEANKMYTLSTNSSAYRFTNIPLEHPMAILNNGTSAITVSPAPDYIEIVVSGGQPVTSATNGEFYTFTYNNTAIHFGRGGTNTDNQLFKFMRGGKYRFKTNSNISSHPFVLYINGSSVGSPLLISQDIIEVTLPSDIDTSTAANFKYQCDSHPDSMTNTLPFTDKTVSGTTSDGTYDFYYGDIDVTVTDDFGTVSVYCYYHGYMGGENLLTHT